MEDMKQQMQQNFLKYASYVILDRAIPNVVDGLKPVQRRILHTLYMMDNGKLHKVANAVGQTMAYHPHGDAPITEALVNLANKNYLLDRQGNFGNPHTGDPSAAARYIETRLSELSRETLFNPDLTDTLPTYDGRLQEPTTLPAKIPVLLMQGAEGIAVGMATKILPHNFIELLEAEIAILENKPFHILPDFPTGGIMDARDYNDGQGKVKLRAKISVRDDKTIVISEVCYGTTTESLIHSIDEAAKKGKIKIESIHDFSSDKVEIEIKLPRGQHASQLVDALYLFTDCAITLNPQMLVIKDQLPWETTVTEILKYHTHLLQGYLQKELEIERDALKEKIFQKTLEQIFISNRLYKRIEEIASQEKIHSTIAASLVPYHEELSRIPTQEDREKLLSIPIRRISRFDIDRNQADIAECLTQLARVEKELKQIVKVTIQYLKGLIKKYAKEFPRKTEIQELGEVDKRSIDTRKVKVYVDLPGGFVGTKVTSGEPIECSSYDKLLFLYKDGSYAVSNIPEKQFFNQSDKELLWVGVADKKRVLSVIYREGATDSLHAKRFVVEKFILDKAYRFCTEEQTVVAFTDQESGTIEIELKPQPRQKSNLLKKPLEEVPIKGVSSKGIRLSTKEILDCSISL